MAARATQERLYQIGEELIGERAKRVPWKLLERRYGYCRARLNMLFIAAKNRHRQQQFRSHTEDPGLLSMSAAPIDR